MRKYTSDFVSTPTAKAIQTREGSRPNYARTERSRGWQSQITPDLAGFLSGPDMFYLGTAKSEGQPDIQYRGGSPGYLKVLEP